MEKTLEIVKYPSEVLRQKSTLISKKADKGIMEKLQQAAKYIMDEENHAAGLALPQIGILKRGFVMLLSGKAEIVINPRILKQSGLEYDTEGCLSVTESVNGEVARPEKITVQYLDQNWKLKTKNLFGWNTRVFCHELDHLDGILYFDHIKEED